MEFVIGIDCGATSAKLKVYSLNENELFDYKTGPANFATDFENAFKNLIQLLKTIFSNKQFLIANCKNCIIGAAGIESGDNKTLLRKKILDLYPELEKSLKIMTDAQLAHIAKLENKKGILVISGTGSAVIDNLSDGWKITGGWGYLLGDEGSGYWIGLQALRQIMAEIDTEKPVSEQSKSVYKKINVKENDRAGVLQWAYSSSRSEIASLAKLVTNKITLALAGEELANQVLRATEKSVNDYIDVAVNGSVIENNEMVFSSFKKSLLSSSKTINIVESKNEATYAAVFTENN